MTLQSTLILVHFRAGGTPECPAMDGHHRLKYSAAWQHSRPGPSPGNTH